VSRLELELELAVELKQALPQTQEEVPQQQEIPQGQEGPQQTGDHLVLLLVKMNARAAADQKNHQSPYRRGLISSFFYAHSFGD
jgi:hypothetical protein